MKQEDLFDSLSDHFEAKAEFGETEELTEANFVIPEESDYIDFGEDTEEVDVASPVSYIHLTLPTINSV